MYDVSAELQGFKKASAPAVQVDAAATLSLDSAWRPGPSRKRSRSRPRHSAADRRRGPQNRRRERHRAPVVLRPQPDRRRGAQDGRHRRQLQQLRVSAASTTAASTSTAAGPTRTPSPWTARSRSAPGRPARSSASRTSTRSRKCRCSRRTTCPNTAAPAAGQIRFITKSGSNQFPGNAFVLLPRRVAPGQLLGAQPQPPATENSGPAPFDYKQFGLLVRRARSRQPRRTSCSSSPPRSGSLPPGRDQHRHRADREDAQRATSASCSANAFFSGAQIIRDPATGQPFPNNVIPREPAEPERARAAWTYPPPTAGFTQGRPTRSSTATTRATAEGQPPLRLPAERQEQFTTATASTTGWRRRVPRDLPVARTDWDRPNTTQTASWTSTIDEQPDQRVQLTRARWTRSSSTSSRRAPAPAAAARASTIRTSSREGDRGQDPDGEHRTSPDRRRTVPGLLARADSHLLERDDVGQGTPLVQGGRRRSSTRARTTSIRSTCNAIPGGTNNQNGRFEFTERRAGRTGLGMADVALGLFTELRRDRRSAR